MGRCLCVASPFQAGGRQFYDPCGFCGSVAEYTALYSFIVRSGIGTGSPFPARAEKSILRAVRSFSLPVQPGCGQYFPDKLAAAGGKHKCGHGGSRTGIRFLKRSALCTSRMVLPDPRMEDRERSVASSAEVSRSRSDVAAGRDSGFLKEGKKFAFIPLDNF